MKNKNLGVWLLFGMIAGVAIGLTTDNLVLWVAVGVAVGLAIGASRVRKDKEDEN